jgi:methionine biosynthesis protein MetW
MTGAERIMNARPDFAAIARWIGSGRRVLDLGCGDGTLLDYLKRARAVHGYGIEIDDQKVTECVRSGVNVLQMNLESGLSAFRDGSFDYVILSQTLQAVRHTEDIMREMLRVGREAIVSFPNFGHWAARLQVARGRMPVSAALPNQWFDTPNVHLCTIHDFEALCDKLSIRVLERVVLHGGRPVSVMPNLRGSLAVYRCTSG